MRTTNRNLKPRLFQVWLDQHKALFYRFVPLAKDVNVGDITSRVKLREKLKCKSFDWYLDNLLPMLPTEKRLLASGQVFYDQSTIYRNQDALIMMAALSRLALGQQSLNLFSPDISLHSPDKEHQDKPVYRYVGEAEGE